MPRGDARVAVDAAAAGARVLRQRYGGPLSRFAKLGRDFATEADLEAEHAVRAVIADAFPDDAFLGEEGGLSGPSSASRTWLVDPLCGTLNFAARTPLAGVNVALRSDRELVASAVADPFSGEIFWTDGTTARVRSAAGEAPMTADTSSSLVDVDFDRRPEWSARLVMSDAFTGRFGLRVSSTSLALAWVAAGRRAAYVVAGEVADSVHFAAGIALARATGCVVTDVLGEPVGAADCGLIAAGDAATHAALLQAVPRTPSRFVRQRKPAD